MMLGHPDRDGRSDERSSGLTDTPSDDLGADRVGADQAGRTVLLGRADRQDDAPARFEVGLDLHPSLQLQLHWRTYATESRLTIDSSLIIAHSTLCGSPTSRLCGFTAENSRTFPANL